MSDCKCRSLIVALFLLFGLTSGCGYFVSPEGTAEDERAVEEREPQPGNVRVSFKVNFFPVQKTLWIEDEGGDYIRSLHVSQWMREEGEEYNVLPDWLAASRGAREQKTEQQIDAFTSATLRADERFVFNWDLTDWQGTGVDEGVYRIILQCDGAEGVIITWTAKIEIGDEPAEVKASPQPAAHPEGLEMYVEDVLVEFKPE